jgi:FkbM family methyltransferase
MAQVSRAIKTTILRACPLSLRDTLLRKYPNLRKAAPPGRSFVFGDYHSGIKVNVDTRFKVERIMWSGIYERPLMRYLDTFDMHGWTCMDIGANVGAVALVLAKKVGDAGKVFAFEPGGPNLQRLRSNFDLNPGLASVTEIVPNGVSSSRTELWWSEEVGNPGNAALGTTGTHSVPVTTVDDFVREHNVTRLDFMKVDVEGMELDVFQGARESLTRFRPILYYETLSRYGSAQGGGNFNKLDSFLISECGYTLHEIDRNGRLRPTSGSGRSDYTVGVPR